jgi:response regulator RpfG family c-di-GMP phosphodiesterase
VEDRYPAIPRILLTGYADLSTTVEAINEGQISRYISKPWIDEELIRVVEETLEAEALRREKVELESQIREQNEELDQLNRDLEKTVERRLQDIKKTNERLKTNYVASIKVFSNLIDLRGGNLSGHSRRVAELAVKMGTELKLPKPTLQEILLASLLHDVGKIGFPDRLNSKPLSQMNIDETRLYKSHSVEGQSALAALGEMGQVGLMVRHHHEMWDGSGYPDALAGDRIPLGARIICLANDYDGLIAGTLAAAPLKPEQALKLIQLGRGSRYDPDCLEAFQKVLFKDVASEHEKQILATEVELGMVLSRDLYSSDGTLLGVAKTQLMEVAVTRLRAFQNPDNSPLKLWVRKTREEIVAARQGNGAPAS